MGGINHFQSIVNIYGLTLTTRFVPIGQDSEFGILLFPRLVQFEINYNRIAVNIRRSGNQIQSGTGEKLSEKNLF